MRKMIENMSFKRIKHSIVWRVSKWKWALLHKLLFRLVPICQNKVCVISWGGKYFNCNPKAIATYIASHNCNNLHVVAVVNNPIQYKASYPNIKFVKTKSFGQSGMICLLFAWGT